MTDAITDIFAELFANPLVTTGLTMLGLAWLALWLAAAWWAYQDAARRSESTLAAFLAAAWVILSTPLMLPIALAIYGFARPPVAAGDARTRALVRELGAIADGPSCPSCQMAVEASWLRCPTCSVWLAAPCGNCGAWSARDLEACPYCGREEHAAPVVEPEGAPAALPVTPGVAVGPGLPAGPFTPAGGLVRALAAAAPSPTEAAVRGNDLAAAGALGHETAAAGMPAAAIVARTQRGRDASSARPFSYARSRDASSASS